jgi:hypothetical protein
MHTSCTKMPWTVAGAALLLASVLLAGTTSRTAGEEVGVEVKPVRNVSPSREVPRPMMRLFF